MVLVVLLALERVYVVVVVVVVVWCVRTVVGSRGRGEAGQ